MQYLEVGYTPEPFTAIQIHDSEDINHSQTPVQNLNQKWSFAPSFFPQINFFGLNCFASNIQLSAKQSCATIHEHCLHFVQTRKMMNQCPNTAASSVRTGMTSWVMIFAVGKIKTTLLFYLQYFSLLTIKFSWTVLTHHAQDVELFFIILSFNRHNPRV